LFPKGYPGSNPGHGVVLTKTRHGLARIYSGVCPGHGVHDKMRKEFGPLFWMHLVLILLAYASPFLFNVRFISSLTAAYYVQLFAFNGCILSKAEFQEDISFYQYYLSKAGIPISRKTAKTITMIIAPLLIIAVSLLWQVALDRLPLFF
jgi:hypothetical protein